MMHDREDFLQRVLAHAKVAMARAPKVDSEAQTNASLVQPFLTMLGYDIGNPDEVSQEHHADFAEKYQNKVDFAILHEEKPVIAIESKKVGSLKKEDVGQLRGYFNAAKTVKLGILTDGLKFDFYADSDSPNMMDDSAYLRVDLARINQNGTVDENTLDGLAAIRKTVFNPDNVGAEAKRKLLLASIVESLKRLKSDPTDDFVRFILGHSVEDIKTGEAKRSRLTQKIVEESRDVVRSAMEAFVAQEVLVSIGYTLKDVVRTSPDRQDTLTAVAAPIVPVASVVNEDDLSTLSKFESEIFEYTKNRLFYLIKNDILFAEVEKLEFRKTKTSLRIYYQRPNNGSIFDCKILKDNRVLLQFPALASKEIAFEKSSDFDDCLLEAFTLRAKEAGFLAGSATVLRAISGGQSAG